MTTDPVAAVLKELGGNTEIAAEIGVDDTTVSTWRRRGIPARRWPALVELASRKGKPVTFETLAALPRPEAAE